MSKELEALNKIQHDFGQLKGQELVSCYETIFNALKRLEAIDNANPSEALECLEEIKSQSPVCHYDNGSKSYVFEKEFDTIKQALLKAQELPEPFKTGIDLGVIKSKQYLKWEDLEFDDEWKYQEVKLNGAKYTIKYKCGFNFFDNYYKVVKIYNQDKRKQLLKIYNNDKFFNYLHLERVEE